MIVWILIQQSAKIVSTNIENKNEQENNIMIFYFTGTGNSGYVAQEIAKLTNDKAVSISKLMNAAKKGEELEYSLEDNEPVGIIFPVYAYSAPKMVREFIKNIKFTNYNNNYFYTVANCGDDAGNAAGVVEKLLEKKGIHLNSRHIMYMPNNYIILYDVDSKEEERRKLEKNADDIKQISEFVSKKADNTDKVKTKLTGRVLTFALAPLFEKLFIRSSGFRVTDECVSCGKCRTVCTTGIIELHDGRPQWEKHGCSQCLACINYCPVKAIQFGKSTGSKGRYTNPYFENTK